MNVRLKPPQFKVFRCAERFRVLVAGRRFGKTYLALVELCVMRVSSPFPVGFGLGQTVVVPFLLL